MELILTKVRLAFPALYEPRAMAGDPNSKPAYGGKLIIEPGSENAKKLMEAMQQVAKEQPKYGANWQAILDELIKKERVCYVQSAYLDKDGKPRDGFEGMHYLSCRSEKLKPTVKDRFNNNVLEGQPGAPYAGCLVHAAVDVWAQDNNFGRRINCTLQGVMFADDGPAFGGGRPANESTFAGLAAAPSTEDFV